MANALRMTEEQWREDCAKRERWTTHVAPVVNANPPVAASRKAQAGPLVRTSAGGKAPLYPIVGMCQYSQLPIPAAEYAFAAPARKWRADYCWVHHKLIVEIDGGVWSNGRHTRGAGFLKDLEKLNHAALLGFRVMRYAPNQMAECLRDLKVFFAHPLT